MVIDELSELLSNLVIKRLKYKKKYIFNNDGIKLLYQNVIFQ